MGEGDPGAGPAPPRRVEFDAKLIELLVCPLTKQPLRYDATRQELVSMAARLAFPIREGCPVLVADEARDLDADGSR